MAGDDGVGAEVDIVFHWEIRTEVPAPAFLAGQGTGGQDAEHFVDAAGIEVHPGEVAAAGVR